MINRTILEGDVLEKIQEIPDRTIDCVISSPPYWGLRDYGVKGQWGLESDFHEYLDKMNQLMVAIKRVLKDTGTVWINLGDSYNSSGSAPDHQRYWDGREKNIDGGIKSTSASLQTKPRLGIPERFYINCIDNGWIARNHIPWYKSNSMPSSVKDRFTNKWESIFFFAKQQKYYFNLDAIREKTVTETKPFNIRVRENITGHAQAKLGDRSWTASDEELETHNEKGERTPYAVQERDKEYVDYRELPPLNDIIDYLNEWRKKAGVSIEQLEEKFGNWTPHHWFDRSYGSYPTREDWIKTKEILGFDDKYDKVMTTLIPKPAEKQNNPQGKNPGDVFFINPQPFFEAHFATFPLELPLKILKCACSSSGTVLDPFFGAGTVGLAAEKLGLKWIGIELNPKYVSQIIKSRLNRFNNHKLEVFD